MKNPLLYVVAGFVALIVLTQTFYSVHQTQQALVLQLGKPVSKISGPGMHVKIPIVQNVIYFDARILDYNAKPAEVLTSDKKTLVVDNYTKWRIVDPLMFYRTVRTIPEAQARLDDIIYSQLRVALGRYTLTEIVSVKRPEIMAEVTERSAQVIKEYGIEVLDVRIKRTDLPSENQRAIYGRMQAERERQAKQYRSEGQEESAKIKSGADRDKAVILADAKKKADILRGEGDAEATKIYAESLGQAPEFYAFKRSLDAYVESFKHNTRIILTPDNPFLQYMK
jgi:membrane protease subunit HflC